MLFWMEYNGGSNLLKWLFSALCCGRCNCVGLQCGMLCGRQKLCERACRCMEECTGVAAFWGNGCMLTSHGAPHGMNELVTGPQECSTQLSANPHHPSRTACNSGTGLNTALIILAFCNIIGLRKAGEIVQGNGGYSKSSECSQSHGLQHWA